VSERQRAWAVTLVVFFAGIVVAANRFKVPPVMQSLMEDLNAGMVTGGWFMSVVSLAGVLLAIPAAFVVSRLGVRATGMVALSCALAGAVVGAVAGTATALLAGRVVEGISVGLMTVVAPTTISLWFQPQHRGVPMGLWATWVPLGNVFMFNLAHPLRSTLGWRAVWWFGALLALVALVVFALLVAEPSRSKEQRASNTPQEPSRSLASFARSLLCPASWLLALIFGAFGFGLIAYNTWAPAYLTETLGIAPAVASLYASLMFLASIPGNLVGGWLVDRSTHRYRLITLGLLATGAVFWWSFRLGSVAMVVPYMLLLGLVSGVVPTAVFTLAPDTLASQAFAGLGVAIAVTGSNIGALTGPPVLGKVLSGGNWALGSVFLVLSLGLGVAAALAAGRLTKRREIQTEAWEV
jgi:MFS family permease